MNSHEQLVAAFEAYVAESEKFEEKGNKAAGSRARKALSEMAKLCKARRMEIQAAKAAK